MSPPDEPRIDPATVASLFDAHGEALRQFLVGILKRRDLADDVLQATFAKALEQGHTAQQETLKGWLFRVAYHEAIVVRRRQAIDYKARDRLAAGWRPGNPEQGDALVQRETVDQVRRALEALPAEQRQVVRLRIYQQMKFIEIAAELNVPLGTVLSRMQAGLKKLRQAMGGTGD